MVCRGYQCLPVYPSRWRPNIRSCHPPLCALPNLSCHRVPSSHPPAHPAAKKDVTAGGSHDGPHYWHRGACARCDSTPPNKAVAHSWGHILQSPHQDLGPYRVGEPHGGSSHRRHLTNSGSRVGRKHRSPGSPQCCPSTSPPCPAWLPNPHPHPQSPRPSVFWSRLQTPPQPVFPHTTLTLPLTPHLPSPSQLPSPFPHPLQSAPGRRKRTELILQ